jgi:hypothetical protein
MSYPLCDVPCYIIKTKAPSKLPGATGPDDMRTIKHLQFLIRVCLLNHFYYSTLNVVSSMFPGDWF